MKVLAPVLTHHPSRHDPWRLLIGFIGEDLLAMISPNVIVLSVWRVEEVDRRLVCKQDAPPPCTVQSELTGSHFRQLLLGVGEVLVYPRFPWTRCAEPPWKLAPLPRISGPGSGRAHDSRRCSALSWVLDAFMTVRRPSG